MIFRTRVLPLVAIATAMAGCSQEGELVINQGVGITAVLTKCPAVGIQILPETSQRSPATGHKPSPISMSPL